MTINKSEITTTICQLSSLYQLLENKEQLGEPCLLLIHTDSSTVLGRDDSEKAAVREFLSEAPFMSAVVSDSADSELADAADMFIKAEEADEYIEKLFKDKTKKQIQEINACFIAARKAPASKVLDIESRAFYRLMADKNGGNSND